MRVLTEYPARYEVDWLHRRPRRVFVRVLLAVVAFAGFGWPLSWWGGLIVACLTAGGHFLYCWRRHHMATAWQQNAYAERRAAHLLLPLEKEGYRMLHDRRLGATRLHHVVIGPSGVWLVHGVGRARRLRILGDAAYLHPEEQSSPPGPGELRDRAAQVADAFGRRLGETVTVAPVFVVFGADTPETLRDTDDVPVVPAAELLDRIRGRDERPAPEQIERISAVADSVLPADESQPERPGLPPMAVKKSLWSGGRGPRFIRETEVRGPKPDGSEEPR